MHELITCLAMLRVKSVWFDCSKTRNMHGDLDKTVA